MINQIVAEENLATDYNIYVFHGTDGDDWDRDGHNTIAELKTMLSYSNRIGITIAEHLYTSKGNTQMESYLKQSGLLEQASNLLRLDSMKNDATEERIIKGIRNLVSE